MINKLNRCVWPRGCELLPFHWYGIGCAIIFLPGRMLMAAWKIGVGYRIITGVRMWKIGVGYRILLPLPTIQLLFSRFRLRLNINIKYTLA